MQADFICSANITPAFRWRGSEIIYQITNSVWTDTCLTVTLFVGRFNLFTLRSTNVLQSVLREIRNYAGNVVRPKVQSASVYPLWNPLVSTCTCVFTNSRLRAPKTRKNISRSRVWWNYEIAADSGGDWRKVAKGSSEVSLLIRLIPIWIPLLAPITVIWRNYYIPSSIDLLF